MLGDSGQDMFFHVLWDYVFWRGWVGLCMQGVFVYLFT